MFSFRQPAPQARSLSDGRIAELDDSDHLAALMIDDISIPFIPFSDIVGYLQQGFAYKLEPKLDRMSSFGNQIISLRKENELRLAEIQFDSMHSRIFPPK